MTNRIVLRVSTTSLLAIAISTSAVAAGPRTVIDNELGSIFTWPNATSGFSWRDVGAMVNTREFFAYPNNLNPQALKVVHGRFHVMKPSDDYSWVWFPYSELRKYEAREIAAGKPPIFITATYQGKKRPVLWNWSLGLMGSNGGTPTTPPSEWKYAVNVQDDRFIKFWINRYVRGILWKDLTNRADLQNLWVGVDESAFIPGLYGVLDDSKRFIPGVKWDAPFPQNDDEYFKSVNTFFTRVKQLAPDVNIMPNFGGMIDWSRFPDTYQAAPGLMAEEIFVPSGFAPDTEVFLRNWIFNLYNAYSLASSQRKVMILQAYVPANSPVQIRSAYATYLLLKGPNTFYSPQIAGTTNALPLSTYSHIPTVLGEPVGAIQSVQQAGTPSYHTGFRMYWREYEGGIVYVNWTGTTKAVTLPAGRQHYDRAGNPVTQLTLSDLTGDYVLFYSGKRSQRPRINPRFSSPVVGPLTVTITNPASSGTVYYTQNGVVPYTYSPVYTGPFQISSNKTIKGRLWEPLTWTSFTAEANYTFTSGAAQVGFASPNASGPAGVYYPVVSLNGTATTTITVPYTVYPQGQPSTNGTVTFRPGDRYRYFPITGTVPTTVILASPQGATLGSNYSFRYTLQ